MSKAPAALFLAPQAHWETMGQESRQGLVSSFRESTLVNSLFALQSEGFASPVFELAVLLPKRQIALEEELVQSL